MKGGMGRRGRRMLAASALVVRIRNRNSSVRLDGRELSSKDIASRKEELFILCRRMGVPIPIDLE